MTIVQLLILSPEPNGQLFSVQTTFADKVKSFLLNFFRELFLWMGTLTTSTSLTRSFSVCFTKNKSTGGSPGQVVMGGDSCSEGHGFESHHHTLDGIFHIYLL